MTLAAPRRSVHAPARRVLVLAALRHRDPASAGRPGGRPRHARARADRPRRPLRRVQARQACADAGIKPLLGVDLPLPDAPEETGPPGRPGDAARGRPPGLGVALPPGLGRPRRVGALAVGRRGSRACRETRARARRPTAAAARAADDDVPAVTPELVAEHAAGLILLLGPASDVGRAVAARRRDQARRLLDRWRSLGCETVVEIVDHLEHKSTVNAVRLAELARDTGTTAVLANAVRYLDPADSPAAQVLDAARNLVPLGSPRLVAHNGRAYLAGPADMARVAERVAAAMTGPGGRSADALGAARLLAATAELARRCALDPAEDLGVGAHHLPETQGAVGEQQRALRARCEHAILAGRYRTAHPSARPGIGRQRAARNARDRLEHELAIIGATGMAPYFLTVADVADRDPRGRHPLRDPGLGRGQLRQPPARHQRHRPARARSADGAVPHPGAGHAARHRPGRRVRPPPGRVPDHLRRLRGGAHRLRLHDGDLPGAQRDQGRRRRDVASPR